MPEKPGGDPEPELNEKKPRTYPIVAGALVVLAATCLLGYVYFRKIPVNSGQNSDSYALLGHRAFRELMTRQGFYVLTNCRQIPASTNLHSILYVAPDEVKASLFLRHSLYLEIDKSLEQGATVCYACRKWEEQPDPLRPGWIYAKTPVDLKQTREELMNFSSRIQLARAKSPKTVVTFAGKGLECEIEADNLQVFSDTGNAEILADSSEGPLVIALSRKKGRLILVADSDIFTNYGLAKAGNCQAASQIAKMTATGDKIILDEVAHGFGKDPGILEILFSFPAICLTLHLIVLAGFATVIAARPFLTFLDMPRPERSREEQVKSVAFLTYATRGHATLLQKYFHCVLRELQQYYPNLTRFDIGGQIAYLDTIAEEKEIQIKLAELYQRMKINQGPKKVFRLFYNLYLWKERMIYGQHS